ncbi:MAG: SDR family NAD(P)-dependent oxidoreductase [Pseudomonadota bacterium]
MADAANPNATNPGAANDDLPAAVKPGSSDVPVVVITGASRGIGYALGKAFGAKKAHVVAIARTVGGLEQLDDEITVAGGTTTLVPLDLKDHDAIDRLGLALFERFGRVDVLISNAGILNGITPINHVKPKDFDTSLSVNVTANYRLIRSMDLLLRRSDAGRAIFLTCAPATRAKPFWGEYAMSKAALESMVRTYAAEMTNTSVRVNLFDPGPVRTALRARAVPGEDATKLPLPDDVIAPVMDLASPDFQETGVLFDGTSGTIKRFQDAV